MKRIKKAATFRRDNRLLMLEITLFVESYNDQLNFSKFYNVVVYSDTVRTSGGVSIIQKISPKSKNSRATHWCGW